MDLHWSWESSPSPRGFTIKCFIQWPIKDKKKIGCSCQICFNILTLVDFQVQLGVWFLHNNNAATHTRFVFHNHQIHWKLILTSCVCCNFAIFQLWLLRFSGPSKKVRRVWHLQYSGWQDHGCPEDVSFHIGAHTLKKLRIKKNQRLGSISHSWRSCPLYEDTRSLR